MALGRNSWIAGWALSCIAASACGPRPAEPAEPLAPGGLRCDLLRSDGEVETTSSEPRFSWEGRATGSGERQVAYRVLVAPSPAVDEDGTATWDSGVVPSSQSSGIRYTGRALVPGTTYHWRVRTWSETGGASGYSAVHAFRVRPSSSATPRLPLVSELVEPSRVVKLGPGRFFVEFPGTAYGTLALDLPHPRGASELSLTIGEHRVGDSVWRTGDPGLPPETAVTSRTDRLPWSGSSRWVTLPLPVVDSPAAAPLPDGLAGILPFRYADVSGDPAALDGARFWQLAVSYPFDLGASRFSSSAPLLDEVWALAKHTMKVTTALGVYVDGSRERIPYEADAFINQMGHYGVDADYSLARFSLRHLLENATWPTEWVMHAVFMAWEDFLYTGDDSFLRAHYDALSRKTLTSLAREDGLISTMTGLLDPQVARDIGLPPGETLRDIVDWPPSERSGYEMVPVNTVVNLFHFRALALMASIADSLDRQADADAFHARAERVRASIQARLLDRQVGLFVDGEGSSHASFHANMFALAFGVVPTEALPTVLAFVKASGMACSVYGAYHLLEGLYAHGEDAHALSLLTSRGLRGWVHMIHDLGASTTHEAWDPSVKPNEDWNHAWGAAPASVIPRWLVGIRPIEPGFATFVVAPRPGSLEWIEMQVPTIRGSVVVRVQRTHPGVVIDVVVPPNSAAVIHPLCDPGAQEVWLDGRLAAVVDAGQPVAEVRVRSGPHTVECL